MRLIEMSIEMGSYVGLPPASSFYSITLWANKIAIMRSRLGS